MPRPKQRTPELRDHLLQAAIGALAEGGVAGFTTRRIATTAGTSVPAVYELFGDKPGLVREIFFEGFRRLARQLDDIAETGDPRADLAATVDALRAFVRGNPVLTDVMFSRPFADFDPGPEELTAGATVRTTITGRLRRCVAAGTLAGDPIDLAHVVLAVAQGLARQESAGWLGSSQASRDRRWSLAYDRILAAPPE